MGSVITVKNRREYMKSQEEAYIRNENEMYEARKAKILEMEGEDSEKQAEIDALEEQRMSEDRLKLAAKNYAVFQANKESKHYKSYLAGKAAYKYRGQVFPVLTEEFIMRAKSLKPIINIEEENENSPDGSGHNESNDSPTVPADSEGWNGKTL